MPAWKKVITSGSNASLNQVTASFISASRITGSLFGSSSYSLTSSYALNGGVTQIVAGTNISISPTDGLGAVTINSTGGSGVGAVAKLTQTTPATVWAFAHNLGERYPVVNVYDSAGDALVPGRIETIDSNNLNVHFTIATSGTAVAVVGGTAPTTASYSNTFVVSSSLLASQQNFDVDTGTEVVATINTGSYSAAFFDYFANDGTNYRAGTVMSVWNTTGTIKYTDNSTEDIGNTSGVTLSVVGNGSNAELRATVTTNNWNIKAFVRAI
jgi:hypothetical protein